MAPIRGFVLTVAVPRRPRRRRARWRRPARAAYSGTLRRGLPAVSPRPVWAPPRTAAARAARPPRRRWGRAAALAQVARAAWVVRVAPTRRATPGQVGAPTAAVPPAATTARRRPEVLAARA